jgi:hypothetical protein
MLHRTEHLCDKTGRVDRGLGEDRRNCTQSTASRWQGLYTIIVITGCIVVSLAVLPLLLGFAIVVVLDCSCAVASLHLATELNGVPQNHMKGR